MKRVAIVVQRCHESVVGGSEALAWQYATLLSDAYEVDVLSTTAVDAAYWTNVLPEGTEARDGINIRRFHVDVGYSPYRTELFVRMLDDFVRFGAGRHTDGARYIPWPIPLQEELIRRIGPYSENLVRYLRESWSDYAAIIFVTYLYPTAYFGLMEVPRGRALFAPTLHDEQPAYLSVYKHAARRAHSLIWLTDAERRLGQDLWGELPGCVVAMAIDARPRRPAEHAGAYLLYCGRIDPNKGCRELFDYFLRFAESYPEPLKLILTGKDDIPVPEHPLIDFRGFVSSEEKLSLMAGASVYVMPSARESFSIVTLEAMAQRSPALVNGASDVLADHVARSGGGSIYRDYESFAGALSELLPDRQKRLRMGERGRDYVLSRYTPERVRKALVEAVESCAAAAGRSPSVASVAPAISERKDFPAPGPLDFAAQQPATKTLTNAPPLPLPAGWSEAELRDLIGSVQVEDAPLEEMKNYANTDFRRFIYTLGLVPERPGLKILELGANPYFMTTLLVRFRNAELYLANYFGHPAGEESQRVTVHQTGEALNYSYQQFNVERDAFPYSDDSFDVVLFCEIIEHLLSDPVQALSEIKRVLKPSGVLVLTTPNVARFENAQKLIIGQNVYDPYSGYGPYGRHNREYTPQDIFALLTANGFTVGTLFTADVQPPETSGKVSAERIMPLVRHRQTDLGQYIFCRSSINLEAKLKPPVRPSWLYRSLHDDDEGRSKLTESDETVASPR